jgi:hypothetical protein
MPAVSALPASTRPSGAGSTESPRPPPGWRSCCPAGARSDGHGLAGPLALGWIDYPLSSGAADQLRGGDVAGLLLVGPVALAAALAGRDRPTRRRRAGTRPGVVRAVHVNRARDHRRPGSLRRQQAQAKCHGIESASTRRPCGWPDRERRSAVGVVLTPALAMISPGPVGGRQPGGRGGRGQCSECPQPGTASVANMSRSDHQTPTGGNSHS